MAILQPKRETIRAANPSMKGRTRTFEKLTKELRKLVRKAFDGESGRCKNLASVSGSFFCKSVSTPIDHVKR